MFVEAVSACHLHKEYAGRQSAGENRKHFCQTAGGQKENSWTFEKIDFENLSDSSTSRTPRILATPTQADTVVQAARNESSSDQLRDMSTVPPVTRGNARTKPQRITFQTGPKAAE